MTVRVKTSSGSTGWTQIKSIFVKTSGAWSDIANAWVKVSNSGSTSLRWLNIFNKPNVPEIQNRVEITISTANATNQTKKLTGKAYHWTNATSVQYRFRKSTDDINYSNLTTLQTSVNPSSGSSHTNDTYTILQSDLTADATNYFVYVTKATNSSAGTEAESVSYPAYIDMPRNITNLVALNPTVQGEISLQWNPPAQLQGPQSYEIFYGTSQNPTTSFGNTSSNSVTVDNLLAGTMYYFKIIPWTGTNGKGYYGNDSNIVSKQTLAAAEPQPFTTLSFTKNFPSGGSQGIIRSTSLSWLPSTNATNYRIEYWGSNDNVNWTNVQTFAQSPQQITTSHTASWSSPQGSNFNYYLFMRARVQAANAGTVTVISDGGAFKHADGTAPGQPSFGTITTAASGTASIPVTSSSTQGSNNRYEVMEYKYRTSSGSYPSSWSTQSLSSGSGTISLSGLSNSNNPYYIVIRQRNYDELYSSENETSFNIPAQPVYEVTFNGNGGTLSSGPGDGQTSYTYSGTSGTTFTIPSATRSGYTFSQWRYPQSGGDPQFAGTPGNTYTITSNISYWAIWTANTYTVSYNSNGGSGAPSSQTKTHDVTLTLSSTTPTRSGFTFSGWNTASNGTGTSYSPGGSYTNNSSVTLYAQWTASSTPVSWGSMTAPAFNRQNSSSRIRWGWDDQLPSSGDYTASNIKWRVQYSTSNATTSQTSSPAGLISTIVKNRRTGGGLTVGNSTYDNRVSSLSGDYSSGNPTASGEPVTFSTSARYLRYRGEVVGSDGITYVSNYSSWV